MRAAALRSLVWITLPLLRLTARLARLVERVHLVAHETPAALLLVPVVLLAWGPCRLASLALFAACNALARPLPASAA